MPGLVANLELEVGALASQASIGASGALTSQYGIAGLGINLQSYASSGVYTRLQNIVAPVTGALTGLENSLTNSINAVLGEIDATVLRTAGTLEGGKTVDVALPNLNALLPNTDKTSNGVTLNLSTGQINIDLKEVLSHEKSPVKWEALPPLIKNYWIQMSSSS